MMHELAGKLSTGGAYACILAILAVAFLGRVLGQVLVVFCDVGFLPPMDEWQSGLLPYPLLLVSQMMILALQFELSRELWKGQGRLIRRSARLGRFLSWFSAIYFVVMAVRYVVTMAMVPDRHWFGGTIPIVFHWVLALYVYVLSRYHRSLPPVSQSVG